MRVRYIRIQTNATSAVWAIKGRKIG
jgi:hypothetical protein